jgi:hypothetical protein
MKISLGARRSSRRRREELLSYEFSLHKTPLACLYMREFEGEWLSTSAGSLPGISEASAIGHGGLESLIGALSVEFLSSFAHREFGVVARVVLFGLAVGLNRLDDCLFGIASRQGAFGERPVLFRLGRAVWIIL